MLNRNQESKKHGVIFLKIANLCNIVSKQPLTLGCIVGGILTSLVLGGVLSHSMNIWVPHRNDVLKARAENHETRGGQGDDVIRGGPGNDRIFGGLGDDQLFGGQGNDVIRGGPGNDKLTGGPGADVFVCGSGTDRVTDYNPIEGDRIAGNCEIVNH